MSQYIIDILKIENKSWIEDFYYTNDKSSLIIFYTDDKIIWIVLWYILSSVEKSTIQLYEVTLLHKPI